MDEKFSSLLKRLEVVTTKLESMETTGAGAAPAGGAQVPVEDETVPPSVEAFDQFIAGPVSEYVAAAGKLDMPEVRISARTAGTNRLRALSHPFDLCAGRQLSRLG